MKKNEEKPKEKLKKKSKEKQTKTEKKKTQSKIKQKGGKDDLLGTVKQVTMSIGALGKEIGNEIKAIIGLGGQLSKMAY
jgi:hypothetical protein